MQQQYTPVRRMSSRVRLGMNRSDDRRFGRVSDAFRRDSAYWGERSEWYVVAAQTRDSNSLDRSNWAVLLDLLGGESDTVAIERANHWACGWVEYLLIHPTDRASLRKAILADCSVDNYPVLDEDHWSKLEYDEFWELAERELKQFENWADVLHEVQDDGSFGYDPDSGWAAIEAAREILEAQGPA